MSNDHSAKPAPDTLVPLDEVCDLLASHPGFRVTPVGQFANSPRKPSWLGRFIREVRLRRFGAEFAGILTLLRFEIERPKPRTLVLDLSWHAWHIAEIYAGWSVFIHFLDRGGEVRFQGDFPLEGEVPDRLGFVYTRRTIDIPPEAAAGDYRIRLGVWHPSEDRTVLLTRFRGCDRGPSGWFHNAVMLSSVKI